MKGGERRRPGGPDSRLLAALNKNIVKLTARMEAANVAEYVALLQKPGKLLWANFLAGLSRGVGMFLGASVMGALLFALATWAVYHLLEVADMIPVLGHLAQIAREFVQQLLREHPANK